MDLLVKDIFANVVQLAIFAGVLATWAIYHFYIPQVRRAIYRRRTRGYWDSFVLNTQLSEDSRTFRLVRYLLNRMCSVGPEKASLVFLLYARAKARYRWEKMKLVRVPRGETPQEKFEFELQTAKAEESPEVRQYVENVTKNAFEQLRHLIVHQSIVLIFLSQIPFIRDLIDELVRFVFVGEKPDLNVPAPCEEDVVTRNRNPLSFATAGTTTSFD